MLHTMSIAGMRCTPSPWALKTKLARDDIALDFVGTFPKRIQPCVPPIALHIAVRRVAGTSHDLHSVLSHELQALCRLHLGLCCFATTWIAVTYEPGEIAHRMAAGIDPHLHVHQTV